MWIVLFTWNINTAKEHKSLDSDPRNNVRISGLVSKIYRSSNGLWWRLIGTLVVGMVSNICLKVCGLELTEFMLERKFFCKTSKYQIIIQRTFWARERERVQGLRCLLCMHPFLDWSLAPHTVPQTFLGVILRTDTRSNLWALSGVNL